MTSFYCLFYEATELTQLPTLKKKTVLISYPKLTKAVDYSNETVHPIAGNVVKLSLFTVTSIFNSNVNSFTIQSR